MERWESKLPATERRIVISDFVSKAIAYVMEPDTDSSCIGCFEPSYCLLTMLAHDKYDAKIRPQGMPIGKLSIPQVRSGERDTIQDVVIP